MKKVRSVLEKVQYEGYIYDTQEEKQIHINKMENEGYEFLYKLSQGLEATYRKIL